MTSRRVHVKTRVDIERFTMLRDKTGLGDRSHYNYWQGRLESTARLYSKLTKIRWGLDRRFRWRERLDAYRWERGLGKSRLECLSEFWRLYRHSVVKFGWRG